MYFALALIVNIVTFVLLLYRANKASKHADVGKPRYNLFGRLFLYTIFLWLSACVCQMLDGCAPGLAAIVAVVVGLLMLLFAYRAYLAAIFAFGLAIYGCIYAGINASNPDKSAPSLLALLLALLKCSGWFT